jgi:uncharacterized protein (TIGR02646 family)
MSLGPARLDHAKIRVFLKRKDNKKHISLHLKGKLAWSDKSLSRVKAQVRKVLRAEQHGRCIYCRRSMKVERRNATEDIEHFLDKSKDLYKRWAFSCQNLALSCHSCNLEKGIRDFGIEGMISMSRGYPSGRSAFSCIHPYLDDYHANIEIGLGWTYRIKGSAPEAVRAQALIDTLKLTEVEKTEEHSQKILKRLGRVLKLAAKCQSGKRDHLRDALLAEAIALQEEASYG